MSFKFQYFLVLCCLSLLLSASSCPTQESIVVSGKISCDAFNGEGRLCINATVVETDESFNTCSENPNGDLDYEINIPIENLNKEVRVLANWNHDMQLIENCYLSIGDYWGLFGGRLDVTFQLEAMNDNIDINLDNIITHAISGEIFCDEYDGTGCLGVSVWNENPSTGSIENLISAIGCLPPSEPGPFTVLLSNADEEDSLWGFGSWDVDCSGGAPNSGDYTGEYPDNPVFVPLGESSGADFDICQELVP